MMVPTLNSAMCSAMCSGGPVFFRQGDVEVGLGGVGLEGAGRVHGGEGGGAHEGRRLFEGGLDLGGDGDDVVGVDEGDEAGEGVLEGVEELVGGGMDGGEFGEDLLGVLVGSISLATRANSA